MNRLVIVPDTRLEAAGLELKPRLAALTAEINADNIVQLMGPLSVRLLARTAADSPSAELLLWVREGKDYAVAWSSAAEGDALIGKARAATTEGLVARVFESHRSVSQSSDNLQAAEWTNLDRLRGTAVSTMAASPVILFESCAAILSRVLYTGSATGEIPPPSEHAVLLSRLIEDRLIRLSLGLESA